MIVSKTKKGRRRIGKTCLVWNAYEDEPILYFFVTRKAAAFLRATGELKGYRISYKGLSMDDM